MKIGDNVMTPLGRGKIKDEKFDQFGIKLFVYPARLEDSELIYYPEDEIVKLEARHG